jgi:Xaa-Pro dipeptidase
MEYLIAHKDDEDDNASDTEEADNTTIAKLYLLKGLNTDSGKFAQPAYYNGIEKYVNIIDDTTLFTCLVECRVIKSPAEIDLLRYTNWVSSMAHVATMRTCQPNMMEYQLESTFLHYTYYYGGMRHMAYTCICGCGPNSSILHYGHAGRPNSGRVLQTGDMALLDMGGEYHCYASDITCSYPVNGVYTDDQRCIYESVLAAQIAVIGRLKPGVSWVDMHHVAEREILHGLVKCGVLIIPPNNSNNNDGDDAGSNNDNDVIDMMIDVDLGAVFMPHGLGHLIGIDVHDVGGYAPNTPPRSSRPGLKKLRTARTMEAGMVITVEPGCYFIDVLLDMALTDTRQSQYINSERLNDFRGFGGVRLEDDIWITESGCVNLTQCPRAIDEVVHVMQGGDWPRELFDCYILIFNIYIYLLPFAKSFFLT